MTARQCSGTLMMPSFPTLIWLLVFLVSLAPTFTRWEIFWKLPLNTMLQRIFLYALEWREYLYIFYPGSIVERTWHYHTLRKVPLNIYTQRNIFQILLNQLQIRLYLPFSAWFGSKRTSVWIQINRKMVYTIWFWVDLIIFRKKFSVCIR